MWSKACAHRAAKEEMHLKAGVRECADQQKWKTNRGSALVATSCRSGFYKPISTMFCGAKATIKSNNALWNKPCAKSGEPGGNGGSALVATGFRHIQLQQERFLQSKSQHTVWSKACTQRPAKVENLGATEGVHLWQQVLHLGSGNLNQQQREDVQPSLPHSQLRRRGQFRLQQPQQLLQRLSNGH